MFCVGNVNYEQAALSVLFTISRLAAVILAYLAAKILLQKLRLSVESTPQKISHRENLSIKETRISRYGNSLHKSAHNLPCFW